MSNTPHDRDMIWESARGPIKVRDMDDDHLLAAVEQLRYLIRRNSHYAPTHYNRRHEATRQYQMTVMIAEIGLRNSTKIDPRDPDPTRTGIFRDHNCWKCADGRRPCVQGSPNQCEYPHARND